MYINEEVYSDPTAGEAIGNILGRYKKEQREKRAKQDALKSRKKAYIVSKYAGDTAANIKAARKYCRFAVAQKYIPIASHLLFPQFLNDTKYEEREIGLMYGLALLAQCQEVWVFGADFSEGMKAEIEEARKLGKRVRFFNEQMGEVVCK